MNTHSRRAGIGLGLLALLLVTSSAALAPPPAEPDLAGLSHAHAVFAPGTPRSYVDAVEDALLPAELLAPSVHDTLSSRWSTTATDGSGLGQGDPTTLTWSIVPDGTEIPALSGIHGESSDPSNLIARLGSIYGVTTADNDLTDEPWFALLERMTARWSALTGLTYVYEPNDDGAAFSAFSSAAPGQLGVRGDVRIGGHRIDGNNGVLAYNFFPNHGEMVIDTADAFYDVLALDSLRLRNVFAHELGHGIGVRHVESSNASFLMEPFVSTAFDGPQYDDVLAAQRHYGDALEAGWNDSTFTPTPLGTVAVGTTATIGADAASTSVPPSSSDIVSIDDDGDVDVFSFSLRVPAEVDLRLSPLGPAYNRGSQGGFQSSFDASAQSDLTLELVDTDASTVLETANANGLGGVETVTGQLLPAGRFFARVTGSANTVQTYQLDITASPRQIDVGVTGGTNGDEEGPVDGTFEVSQTEPLPDDTVLDYAVTGSAVAGEDFEAVSGNVTIPAGATSAAIAIPVIDDAVVEGTESVMVTLTGVSSSAPDVVIAIVEASAALDITDNDRATVSVASTIDGDEDGPVDGLFTVAQSAIATGDTTVEYTVAGTATPGEDYAALSGTVTIPAGEADAAIVVPTLDDELLEGSEDVVVTLTALTTATPGLALDSEADTATIQILDDERLEGRALLHRAIESVATAQSAVPSGDKDLDKAAAHLADADDPVLWDGDDVIADDGEDVLKAVRSAASRLLKALEDDTLDAGARAAVESALADLVDLVQQQVQSRTDALNALDLTDPDDIEDRDEAMAKAAKDRDKGDRKLADGELDKAIHHWTKAWKDLDEAVEDLTDDNGHDDDD